MKRRKIIAALSIILILLLLTAVWIFTGRGSETEQGQVQTVNPFKEQMDLGEKYLLDQNYEAAAAAFLRAIEIDEKQAESYLKLAEAYAGMEDYENAVLSLERGYEVTHDERLETERKRYQKLKDYEDDFLLLIDLMEVDEPKELWNYMSEDEYQEMIGGLDGIIQYPAGDDNYLLIYPCGHCYYGSMENGNRSGYGIWAAYDYKEELADYYAGEWERDYPCGAGDYQTMCITVPEDLFHEYGGYLDGLENGEFVYEYFSDSYYEGPYDYSADKGIRQKIVDPFPERSRGADYYCYAYSSERSLYCKKGVRQGILHARKGEDAQEAMTSAVYDAAEIEAIRSQIEEEYESHIPEIEIDFDGQEAPEEDELSGRLEFVTDNSRYGILDISPVNDLILLHMGDKGADVPEVIVDTEGKIVLQGYEDSIWLTENGYAKIRYCLKDSEDEAEAMMVYDIAMGEMEGDAYLEVYNWDGELVTEEKISDETLWYEWGAEGQRRYPVHNRKGNENNDLGITWEQEAGGYSIYDGSGENIGFLKVDDTDKIEPVVSGRLLGLRHKGSGFYLRIYLLK